MDHSTGWRNPSYCTGKLLQELGDLEEIGSNPHWLDARNAENDNPNSLATVNLLRETPQADAPERRTHTHALVLLGYNYTTAGGGANEAVPNTDAPLRGIQIRVLGKKSGSTEAFVSSLQLTTNGEFPHRRWANKGSGAPSRRLKTELTDANILYFPPVGIMDDTWKIDEDLTGSFLHRVQRSFGVMIRFANYSNQAATVFINTVQLNIHWQT